MTRALLVAAALVAGCGDGPSSTPPDAGGSTSVVVSGDAAPGARVSARDDECPVPCSLSVAAAGCTDIALGIATDGGREDLVVAVADACRSYRELSGRPTATMSEIHVRLRRETASGRCVASPTMILYGDEGQSIMEPLGLDDAPCGAFASP